MRGAAESIDALRYLIEVVDAGSFSRAASRLGLNASTLCRRIAQIEDLEGITLLERTRVGVRVTSSGLGYVTQARRVLGELRALHDAARANGNGHCGKIRLGLRIPPVAGPFLNLLANWREAHPGIWLKFFELNDQEIRRALTERRLDVAFVAHYSLWPGAAHMPVFRERIMAALPASHYLAGHESLTWDLLRAQTFLTQGWNDSETAREFFAFLMGGGIEFVSHATSEQSILGLVAAGYGITLALESQALLSWPSIVFRHVSEDNAWLDVDLVWPPESEDATAGLFVAFMRDHSALT